MIYEIKIRKIRFTDGGARWHVKRGPVYVKKTTLYLVFVDGRRVDSFERFRNAQRCVKKLRQDNL